MRDVFQDALATLEALEEPRTSNKGTDKTDKTKTTQHNTAAALREAHTGEGPVGPEGSRENLDTPEPLTDETDKTTEAERLGLGATWSSEFGYVSIHDPTTGEWHDLQTKEAPVWAVSEAHKRKALYRDGNRRAYRLTSREMEELWQRDHLAGEAEEGIVEEHPVEEG